MRFTREGCTIIKTTLYNWSPNNPSAPLTDIGVTPDVLPEVENQPNGTDLQSGVSIENTLFGTGGEVLADAIGDTTFADTPFVDTTADTYADVQRRYRENARKKWFVLRATHNRGLLARELLKDEQLFLPTHKKVVMRNGKRRKIEEPLIVNLLFVYTTKPYFDRLLKLRPELSFVSYQYDHCCTDQFGKNPPMEISYAEMANFIRATMVADGYAHYVDPRSKDIKFKSNEMVEITDGKFKGVKGWVVRYERQQRVLVCLKNFLGFATTYIPSYCLRKVGKG